MKNPKLWTKADLYQHLQHAIDVEFWTIPLYLTSLYSIKGLKDLKHEEYPDAAKLIQSVVIQEMLHLELVCNICNALGHSPVFRTPQYENINEIPFIHPLKEVLPEHLHDYHCSPGALSKETLKLFCAIELPHKKQETNWDEQNGYHCIAEMYGALELGILHLWHCCYVGDALNTKQKKTFKEYHNREGRSHGFSQDVNSVETALKALNAIVEQGEGANHNLVPADFRPPKLEEGKEFDPGWFKGHLSHYHKFTILFHHHHKLPEVYSIIEGVGMTEEQTALDAAFAQLIGELSKSFNSDGPEMTKEFWGKMFGLAKYIIAVWEKGAVPKFRNISITTHS